MADPQPYGPTAREVNSLFGSPPRPGRSSGKSPGGCPDERLDGRLELTLGRAQLLEARGAGECSRGLEGGVGEVHQLRVPADKLYVEPGGFRCSTQAVAFDVGLSGFLPARVPLRVEPKGDESSLQLGDGRRKASAGVRLLLSATLVALERLRPLSRAILEQISRERPQKRPGVLPGCVWCSPSLCERITARPALLSGSGRALCRSGSCCCVFRGCCKPAACSGRGAACWS
jgi:hypothetical protein